MLAQSFPPEPIVNQRVIYANVRPDKPFNKLTGKERQEAFYNVDYEQDLIGELTKKLFGVRCEVCDFLEEDGKNLTRCQTCAVVVCDSCVVDGDNVVPEKRSKYRCVKCTHLAEMKKQKKDGLEELVEPRCAVCCQPGGWLRRSKSEPISKRGFWNQNPKKREKSLFGSNVFCHNLCALWCAPGKININVETGVVDLSNVILSNGSGFIKPTLVCFLCGNAKGLKEPCVVEGCHCADDQGNTPYFHPTCARQAGLEVKDDSSLATLFYVKCYRHGGNDFNLRARLEDLIEIETKRAGRGFANQDAPMTFSDASRLLNGAILVLRMLGWAWRWSEWWVDYGSNWEPLLEQGQNEEDMTKEQLKIVESTRESRRDDARRCRLAAFGAALRNRSYDSEDRHAYDYIGGFDHKSLDQALRAVLNTKSLVGPLQEVEIEFLVDWLARAYRSKSRLLGFGKDKVEVNPSREFTRHTNDGSSKFELGSRALPGKQELKEDQVFEDEIDEIDDFDFYMEAVVAGKMEQENRLKEQLSKKSTKRKKAPGRGPARPKPKPAESLEDADATKALKRRPGRPRVKQEAVQERETMHEQGVTQPDEAGHGVVVSEEQAFAEGRGRDRIQRGRKRAREAENLLGPERTSISTSLNGEEGVARTDVHSQDVKSTDNPAESKTKASAESDLKPEAESLGATGTAAVINELGTQENTEEASVKQVGEEVEGSAPLEDEQEREDVEQVNNDSKVHDLPPLDREAAKQEEEETEEANPAEEANDNNGRVVASSVAAETLKTKEKARPPTKQTKQSSVASKASALFRPQKKRKKQKQTPLASAPGTAAVADTLSAQGILAHVDQRAEQQESEPVTTKTEVCPDHASSDAASVPSQPVANKETLSEPPQKKQRTHAKQEEPQPQEGAKMDSQPTTNSMLPVAGMQPVAGSREQQQLAGEAVQTKRESKGDSDKSAASEADNLTSSEDLNQADEASHCDTPSARMTGKQGDREKACHDEKAVEDWEKAGANTESREKNPDDDDTAVSQQPFHNSKQDEKCDSSSSSCSSNSSDSSSFERQLRKIAKKQEKEAEYLKEEEGEEEGDCLEDQLTNVATFCEANSHRKKGRNRGKFEAAACFAHSKQGWFGVPGDEEQRMR